MAEPTDLPIFDENDTNTIPISTELQDDGFSLRSKPASGTFNSWFRNVYKWIEWFQEKFGLVDTELEKLAPVDSIADLREITYTPEDGQVVKVLGYSAKTENRDWSFQWNASSTATDNAGTIIKVTAITTGRWIRLVDGYITDTMFGVTSNGTGETALLQAAIDATSGVLKIETYGTVLTSQVVVRDPCTGLLGGGSVDTGFIKGFNGDAFKVTNQGTTLRSFAIAGDGSNFTGGGIYTVPDNCAYTDLRITDTADSCLIYEHNNSTFCSATRCHLTPTNIITYAIRGTGTDLSTSPTARSFTEIKGGANLVDFSGMNRATLTKSFGNLIKFDANSSKIALSNNRYTNSTSNITILGSNHTIENETFGFGSASYNVIIDATSTDIRFGPTNVITQGSSTKVPPTVGTSIGGTIVNNIYTDEISYTGDFEWLGAASDAVFGNATYNASYLLAGRRCTARFYLLRGSTTVNAVGMWSFTLPFKASNSEVGPCLVKSSTGLYYTAISRVDGSGVTVSLYIPGGTTAVDESSLSFGTGGTIEVTFEYNLASF